jgi:sn-1 stearoyl-lipid 9-desaturase
LEKLIPWTRSNTKIFPTVQLFFTAIIAYVLITQSYSWRWWAFALLVYFLNGCLGIVVTFHRKLTHNSFQMPKALEYFFTVLGAMGGTGSSVGWVALHHDHHTHSDQPGDPHSPAISGWRVLFPNYVFNLDKWSVRYLIIDPFHKYLHDYYHLWLALWAGALFLIDVRVGLFGFVIPVAAQVWSSVITNYVTHSWGYRNFETKDHSMNNPWVSMMNWGEGWHNNHHRYPGRSSYRMKWWEVDISGMVIEVIKFCCEQKKVKSLQPQVR